MDRILKEFKLVTRDKSSDFYEEISSLIYLANLTESEIVTSEIETASNIFHLAFKNLHENPCEIINRILKEGKSFITLMDRLSGNSYRIFIQNTWLFGLILLNSVKHMDAVLNGLDHVNFLISVVKCIITNIVLVKPLSLHLLRTLLFIVTKRKDILTIDVSVLIIRQMNEVALSPITAFRQYARGISKAVMPNLFEEETVLLDISLLPMKGIDMCDVVKCFSERYIRHNKVLIMKKVFDMFQKNVESKDAGILYESLLFYTFEDWKIEIWPMFINRLKCMDYEGEFYQSLLKYWITSNVNAYKSEFYDFLRNEAIDCKIQGYVLLECRKKGCPINNDIMKKDIMMLSSDIETRYLSLRLTSTYHKKSLWPKDWEINVVINYLYSNTNLSLEEEEVKSFHFFFSQIFLYAHNELKKTDENQCKYTSVIAKIYKYCYASLKTDFFEVGTEITFILWNIATGNFKNLQLNYRLEKKDSYANGENLFYRKLKENNVWWFESEKFQQELIKCFHKNNGSSTYLTKLVTKFLNKHPFLCTIDLKYVVEQCVTHPGLDSEKRVKDYSEIMFSSENCEKSSLNFLKSIHDYLINLDCSEQTHYSEDIIFRIVLYLQILFIATRYSKYDKRKLYKIVEQALSVIENVIIGTNSLNSQNYRMTKTVEAFINNIMTCLMENCDILWATINKEKVMSQLIMIIQRSNMKRPLSLSVEVLKRFALKMNGNDSDMNYKIHFMDDTLSSLYVCTTNPDLKIRRSPESRLVLHAMYCSDENPNKPLLNWVMTHLLQILSDPQTSDFALSSALHSMELLISDNSLQASTLPFISDVVIQCVELFSKRSWIVRNADLQLTRAIIDRFYGVCLDICNRPKSVQDLLVLFPNLSSYFSDILSKDNLDERGVLVLQFFLESQIKEHICTPKIPRGDFLTLFIDIMQKYPNHLGKMAARSYCALCIEKEIPESICSIIYFCKLNNGYMSVNILVNFLYLIQLLYEKFKKSFYCFMNKSKIEVVNFAINDLLKDLGNDSDLFDFILLTVKSRDEILDEILNKVEAGNFHNRLWLHNNIPFIIINSKPKDMGNILFRVLSARLISCIQIKILSILISKFEKDEFDRETCKEILDVLFHHSFSIADTDHYLLNCYFKTISVFYKYHHNFHYSNKLPQFKDIDSFYKVLILILYFSQLENLNATDKEHFYSVVSNTYMKLNTVSEEMRNDIISTLPQCLNGAPAEFKLKVFKILFYTSLFTSTHLEAYKSICFITGKTYSSILNALKDFFSVRNLTSHLKNKEFVIRFFSDVLNYVPEHFQETQSEGYYSEESDILVPKSFLLKLINDEIQNT